MSLGAKPGVPWLLAPPPAGAHLSTGEPDCLLDPRHAMVGPVRTQIRGSRPGRWTGGRVHADPARIGIRADRQGSAGAGTMVRRRRDDGLRGVRALPKSHGWAGGGDRDDGLRGADRGQYAITAAASRWRGSTGYHDRHRAGSSWSLPT